MWTSFIQCLAIPGRSCPAIDLFDAARAVWIAAASPFVSAIRESMPSHSRVAQCLFFCSSRSFSPEAGDRASTSFEIYLPASRLLSRRLRLEVQEFRLRALAR